MNIVQTDYITTLVTSVLRTSQLKYISIVRSASRSELQFESNITEQCLLLFDYSLHTDIVRGVFLSKNYVYQTEHHPNNHKLFFYSRFNASKSIADLMFKYIYLKVVRRKVSLPSPYNQQRSILKFLRVQELVSLPLRDLQVYL